MSDIQRNKQWHELVMDTPIEHHSLYRKVDRILATHTPGRVLEIGCLDGRFLEHLRARDWDVAGVDIQPTSKAYIVEHDASEPLPYPPSSFDVVVACEVIEHLADTDGFLANIESVLKPGGTLIVTTPNLLFGVNRLRMLIGKQPKFAYADYHVRMFVWSDLHDKLSKRFEVTEVQGSHVLLGRQRGAWTEIFARLGDRLPTLAAHFIVTMRRPF